MDPAKIVVTGAHGFIGRHTARYFARQGHEVTGLGHGGWKVDEWRSWGLSGWHETDISIGALDQYANRPDVILHCAGSASVGLSLSDPLTDFHRTVTTTANVMEYVRAKSPATRVVYPSSASVYGIAETLPIKEDSRCAPISPYGVHKWIAEQLVMSYGRHYRIAASIVRLFSVYGCGLRKQLLWDGCRKLASGDHIFMGTGNEVRDWLHVEDTAELLCVAADHASPLCPVVNGGTGEGVNVRELLTHIANCLHADGTKPEFSETLRSGDPSAYIADASQANSWGWKPAEHWRDRVAEYVAWWQLEMGLEQSGFPSTSDNK
jgi:UDP-glucose 4-epimerase